MRPSDSHWVLLTGAQAQTTHLILTILQQHRVEYVLGGGWAVWAHEPSTPSIDLDIYVPDKTLPPLVEWLKPYGITPGPPTTPQAQQRGTVDAMRLDETSERLGTGDPELYQDPVSYLPKKLFAGRVHPRRLDLGRRENSLAPIDGVPVPDRPSLAFAKLGALHDRSLAYLAYEDGAATSQIGPGVWNQLHPLGQGYFLRKSGKDLFDVSVLLAQEQDKAEAFQLLDAFGHRVIVRDAFARLPAPIATLGADLAQRVQRKAPMQVLRGFIAQI